MNYEGTRLMKVISRGLSEGPRDLYSLMSKFLAVAILISFILAAWGCRQTETNQEGQEHAEITESEKDSTKQAVGEPEQGEKRKPEQADPTGKQETKGGNPMVIMSTSLGDIKIELYADKAPITVENFLSYANDGFYNGTIFHRVIPGFMIQGGGFSPEMQQKPTKAPIKNEADNGLKNEPGTLAMARTNVVDSATSQFFINQVNNDFLNHGTRDFGYAVFGKVVEGMDVVNKIAQVKTGRVGAFQDVPIEPVVIKSVKLSE